MLFHERRQVMRLTIHFLEEIDRLGETKPEIELIGRKRKMSYFRPRLPDGKLSQVARPVPGLPQQRRVGLRKRLGGKRFLKVPELTILFMLLYSVLITLLTNLTGTLMVIICVQDTKVQLLLH